MSYGIKENVTDNKIIEMIQWHVITKQLFVKFYIDDLTRKFPTFISLN